MLLVQLLDRNPQDRKVRRMLADICLVEQDHKAAESHLQLLLAQNDSDAQTHHDLGLLLEATGRSSQAAAHFKRAAELEPDNELYALSLPPNYMVPIANTSGQPVSDLPTENWLHLGD
jgi:Flp pilus assembly protein TadD